MQRTPSHRRRKRESKPESRDGNTRRYRDWWPLLIRGSLVAAVALVPMGPLLIVDGYPVTHELLRYAGLLAHFSDALDAGVFYPRWLPHLAGGYGYPTFVFYQPLFFFVAAGIEHVCSVSAARAVWMACFVFAVVGVAGIYRLARLYADAPASLFTTVLFALTPYHFVNLYVRGDLSEFAAVQIVPWSLFFAAALLRRSTERRRLLGPAVGLAASLLLVVVAHPLIALPAWAAAALLFAAMIPLSPAGTRVRFTAMGAAAFLLAMIASSVYWYPVLQLRHAVDAHTAFEGVYSPSLHIVYPGQLFRREFGFGASTVGDANDGMSFQLGAAHFLLATLGAWFGRRNRLVVVCCAGYLLLIGLMLPPSIPLWKHVGWMHTFQFPWRLLGVIATLQAACTIGWGYVHVGNARNRRLRGALLGLLVAGTAAWHSNQFAVQGAPDFPTADAVCRELFAQSPYGWQTFSDIHEFLPRTASVPREYRGSRELMEVEHGDVSPMEDHSPYHLRFKVRCLTPSKAVIHQFYLPGWRVVVDGHDVPPATLEKTLAEDGRISLSLPACPDGCVVEAWYAGPPGNGIRWVAAISGAILLIGLMAWLNNRAAR